MHQTLSKVAPFTIKPCVKLSRVDAQTQLDSYEGRDAFGFKNCESLGLSEMVCRKWCSHAHLLEKHFTYL